MNRLAIVGIFYDGYYDIWEDFLELLFSKWPQCPYPIYIVNGKKELEFDRTYKVQVIHAGENAEYSLKVQKAIEEINTDYMLLLLEDFFFGRQITDDPLNSIISNMSAANIEYLRMPMPEFLVGKKIDRYKKDLQSGFNFIPNSDEYTVTCQPSIWNKEFLRKCIGDGNYNAWVFEGMYTYSKAAHSNTFLDKCRVDFTNPLGLRHGAVQGKMLPNVYTDIQNTGYFFKNKREVLSEDLYKKHLRKQKIKGTIPTPLQSMIKKIVKSNSVVDKYRSEIVEQMKIMNLE